MSDFLERIVRSRRVAVEQTKRDIDTLEATARDVAPSRGFRQALTGDGVALICEIKRRSPSKGDLNPNLDPAEMARAYERGGARALSVLTEPDFFGGSAEDLVAARDATMLPVLWKDFVLDRVQVVEACARGAD